MTKNQHPLVGWTFLSCTRPSGETSGPTECQWQGEILAVVATATAQGDCALVEFFSWIDGSCTYGQLIPLTEFAKCQDSEHFYKLFPGKEERDEYYDRIYLRAWKDVLKADARKAAKTQVPS